MNVVATFITDVLCEQLYRQP